MAISEESTTETRETFSSGVPAEEGGEASPASPALENDTPNESFSGTIPLLEFAEILDRHREWVESGGESGARADLSGADFAHADLTGANLQGAFLHKVNLRGADLSMANLQGASLVQADLQETNLLGTELRGANLMGATLLGASGLWVGRLGRTNLFGAVLPDAAFDLDGTRALAQATKAARWFYLSLLGFAALCLFLCAATTDLRLLQNSSALPAVIFGNALPMSGFYLGGPLLLFGLYLRFHFLLLRLWGSLAAQPAVFPNGQTLEQSGPWFLIGLVRGQFQWMREGRSPFSRLETIAAALLAYWIVPVLLVMFWLRYLTRQDLRGSLLQTLLVTAAVAAAASLPSIVASVLRPGDFRRRRLTSLVYVVTSALILAGVFGALLTLLSIGIIRGVPQDSRRAPDLSPADIRRWAAEAFWLAGYTPYADLNEAEISPRSSVAASGDDTVSPTQGARLNQVSLRYAQAYRAFLVNARLWRADLEGAYLSEADLRGANLREAHLRWAVLDRARANRAALVGADARRANFAVADLRGADLSYAVLEDAIFAQGKLAGATLYGADLRRAQLLRGDFERADLRDANLEGAVLSLADLHDADLSAAKLAGARLAGVQLKGAILLEADLRKTQLHGAVFQGAVLREALLDGADLDGADLRGAVGLTATQVCSASLWRGAQMDEELRQEAERRCGGGRAPSAN